MTKFMNEAFFTSKDFPFHVAPVTIPSNGVVTPHSHEFMEFVYIAEGNGVHSYQGRSYSIREGDVFVIEPDVEHAYSVGQESKLLVYNVLFEPVILTTELEALSKVTSFVDFFYVEPFLRQTVDFQSHLTLNPHERLEMLLLLDRLVSEYEGKGLGYRILIKTRLIELFIFLSRCYDRRVHKPMTQDADEQIVIRRVCEFIELHHARPLSLGQVSQLCGMSQSAFTAKFKTLMGKTFIEYRNEIRIGVAKELLENTEDKIVYIAQKTGFEDLSFFNKVFRQYVNLSPGEYRKSTK